jgi:predicted ABC-type ATPase
MHLRIVGDAIKQGWSVGIIYIGLRSPELAIERVHLRHLRGGHNVPPADVRRRYERSLKNLATIYKIATRMVVLDNSSSRVEMRRLLEVHRGQVIFRRRRLPRWLSGVLISEGR